MRRRRRRVSARAQLKRTSILPDAHGPLAPAQRMRLAGDVQWTASCNQQINLRVARPAGAMKIVAGED